jgi:Bifunctional DNA primase/polymerase, N-terminal
VVDDDAFEELPEHEPAWAALDKITTYRKRLLAAGYSPVPVNGKRVHLDDWTNIRATNAIIETWATTRADHLSTGVLCRDTPFIDIDVMVEEVAEEIEALFESEIENSAVRIGLPPKRAIPLRTDAPFRKIATQFKDPNGRIHKVEILGDGQQIVVNGIHPDTGRPYRWHGNEPGPKLRREDLPLITAETAAAFVAAAAGVMRAHGWKEIKPNGKTSGAAKNNNNNGDQTGAASIRERAYAQAALDGCAEELASTAAGDRNNMLYKKSFRIATMAARGWIARTEVEAALFDAAMACGLVVDDGEAQTRRTIQSGLDAGAKQPHPDLPDQGALQVTAEEPEAPPRCSLGDAHAAFKKWLGDEYDLDAASAAIAAAASERLPGDPLWLLIVAGPGGAKTEMVQALAGAGAHVTSTIASEGALLSATPRRERNKKATGGLLRKIGDRGVLVIKDVTSILSADRNTRASVLAAIREIYDGRWERNVGTDGGATLTWVGRIVIVGAVTTAWDAAHAVVATMGDRFVLLRPRTNTGRKKAGRGAIHNTGDETAMRKELAAAVGGVVAHMDTAGHRLSNTEIEQLLNAADIVTMARSAVERDYRGNIVFAHDPEMPTRFAKQLVQLLRGAVAIGMTPDDGMRLALRCARDTIPPLRRDILLDLANNPASRAADVRKRISKPRNTVRRELEGMHMLGLLRCDETEDVGRDGKEYTIWRYRLADDYDEETLRTMADTPAGERLL